MRVGAFTAGAGGVPLPLPRTHLLKEAEYVRAGLQERP